MHSRNPRKGSEADPLACTQHTLFAYEDGRVSDAPSNAIIFYCPVFSWWHRCTGTCMLRCSPQPEEAWMTMGQERSCTLFLRPGAPPFGTAGLGSICTTGHGTTARQIQTCGTFHHMQQNETRKQTTTTAVLPVLPCTDLAVVQRVWSILDDVLCYCRVAKCNKTETPAQPQHPPANL